MKNLFEQSRSHWVRYDRYELKTAADGKRYVTPAKDAKPDVYNPMKEMPGMVLDALNVGMLMMGRRKDVDVETAILEFVTKYGLLGLMTALPTTPSFMDYEAVYLPKNHFIKAETMETEDYLALFYPFEQLDMVKKGVESDWTVSNDRTVIALTMTFADESMAKTMSFQREYAEPYDWIAQQLKDWAFTLTAGKADDLLGLPLAFAGYPDDVQLHAGGRGKTAAAVQALPEGVYEQPRQRRFLQRTVQEPV